MTKYLVFIFFLLCSLVGFSQVDTTKKPTLDSTALNTLDSVKAAQDTVKKETRAERKAREKAEKEREKYYYKDILKDSTRLAIEELSTKAWRRSLIAPGWGQITNGGKFVWVKLPIIYGGLVAGYMTFDYWNWYYKKFVDEAAFRIDNNGATNDPDLEGYQSLDGLIRAKDNYRRYRDMTILVTAGWWGLNVLEAYVDSMLRFRYDIGDDLGFKITPTMLPTSNLAYNMNFGRQFTPGVKLTFNFK
ncbi:MAG: DUF5683 domain-containing protein [Sphingobacterium composti]